MHRGGGDRHGGGEMHRGHHHGGFGGWVTPCYDAYGNVVPCIFDGEDD
jgi:hypothetical protein